MRESEAYFLSVHPPDNSGLITLNREIRGAPENRSAAMMRMQRCGGSHAKVRADRPAGVPVRAGGRGTRLRQRAIREWPTRHPRLVQGRDRPERRALLRPFRWPPPPI